MPFGRLERSSGAQPMSDINMTPLIDVMLVLLVIFMIAAPLMVSTLKVDLPKADVGTSGQVLTPVAVTIDGDGQLFVNDQASTLEQLDQTLRQAALKSALTEVQLRADTVVAYGKVVEVMALAQKAGLNRIGFVTLSSAALPR
jgi:biopolymer transport protein TolR